jgi:hypothetical protein
MTIFKFEIAREPARVSGAYKDRCIPNERKKKNI